jgi:hypothetical protein
MIENLDPLGLLTSNQLQSILCHPCLQLLVGLRQDDGFFASIACNEEEILKEAGIEVIVITLVCIAQEGDCIHLLCDVFHCEMTKGQSYAVGNASFGDFGMQIVGEHKKQNMIPSAVGFCQYDLGPSDVITQLLLIHCQILSTRLQTFRCHHSIFTHSLSDFVNTAPDLQMSSLNFYSFAVRFC